MSQLFMQQNTLHEETARLDQACQDLEATSRQRAEELAELSEMLNRVKQQSMPGNVDPSGQASVGTPPAAARATWGGRTSSTPFAEYLDVELSPGGKTHIPRVVQTGLGALSSANKTLSAFQDELNSGLSQLAHQASEARKSASTVRAHVDLLHQLVSPSKAGSGLSPQTTASWGGPQSGSGPATVISDVQQSGTPNSEVASLLRVLQEAAQQRALVETSLYSTSPHRPPLWIEDMLPRNQDAGTPTVSSRQRGDPDLHVLYSGSDDAGPVVTTVTVGGGGQEGGGGGQQQQQQATWSPMKSLPKEQQQQEASQARQQRFRSDGEASRLEAAAGGVAPSLTAEVAEQTQQLRELQRQVQELEEERRKLIDSLESTSSKVACCSLELEAVHAELQVAKAELDAQKLHIKAAQEQRHTADVRLQEQLDQLEHLDALVQASAAQLAELQAHIATASTPSPVVQAAAEVLTATPPTAQRTKLKVRRHQAVRRSQSCTELLALHPELRRAIHSSQSLPATQAGMEAEPGCAQESAAEGGIPPLLVHSAEVDAADADFAASGSTPGASGVAPFSPSAAAPGAQQQIVLQRELYLLQAEHGKALFQLEQERHAGMTQQAELIVLRQRLRALQAAQLTVNLSVSGSGSSAGGSNSDGGNSCRTGPNTSGGGVTRLKRPLSTAMSGMEELLEEAAADLEQLEGHVANVTQRLVQLQAQSLRVAQEVSVAMRTRAAAEEQADEELRRLKALREEADTVQRSLTANQLTSVRLVAELSASKAELQQLETQIAEQRQQLQQRRVTAEDYEERAQEARRRMIQEEHARDLAEQARKAAEHELSQSQARVEEVLQRAQQSEQDARGEVDELRRAADQARREREEAQERLEQLQREARDVQSELAALVDLLASTKLEHAQELEAAAAVAKRRAESEQALQACLDKLHKTQQTVQQGEADVQELQAQLAALKHEHLDLSGALELQKQQAQSSEERVAATQKELAAAQAQLAATTSRRDEAQQALQACLDELRTAQEQVKKGEASVREVQSQLDGLRQEQQELADACQRSEQQAAAAERRAVATEHELEATRAQMSAAHRQLAEAGAQLSALQSTAAGYTISGSSGIAGITPGSLRAGFGGEQGRGSVMLTEHFSQQHGVGLGGGGGGYTGGASLGFHSSSQQHLATIMQLQAEVERLQVATVQAQSRQRLAEQRADDAEQICSELQARVSKLRASQHALRSDMDMPPAAPTSSAALQMWKSKVDELEHELEGTQHLVARYKARLSATQEESSGIEESLQRERLSSSRLREQLEALQQELLVAQSRQQAAEAALAEQQQQQQQQLQQQQQQQQQQLQQQQQQQQQQQEKLLEHSLSVAAAQGSPNDRYRRAGSAAGAVPSATASPAGAAVSPVLRDKVEQAKQQLRALQLQIHQNQKMHTELLEGHAKLEQHGAEMQVQLEQAATQLVTLKAHFEKGKRKVEALQEQKDDLKRNLASLSLDEQQARARLRDLQQQVSAQEASVSGLQQTAARTQQQLQDLRAQVQEAQHMRVAALTERDRALADAAQAAASVKVQGSRAGPASGLGGGGGSGGRLGDGAQGSGAQQQLWGSDASGCVGDMAESASFLKQQLRAARQAQAAAEGSLAEERRQLLQCKAELAATLTMRSAHDAATARLQQDLEKLQALVAQMQVVKQHTEHGYLTTPGSESLAHAATPSGPSRQLTLGSRSSEPTPTAGPHTSDYAAGAAVWASASPAEIAAARRELTGVELRIAVASADEARLTATCAELQRQQAAAEQELANLRQQVAEAEQQLSALHDTAQTAKAVESSVTELSELRNLVRSLRQQAHTAETAQAEAEHQAQLSALRTAHVEEQLRLLQQQTAQQVAAQTARLDEALAACNRERQRANELADHVAQLKHRSEEQVTALQSQIQDLCNELQTQARDHTAQVGAFEAALEQARSQHAATIEALAASRAETDSVEAEVKRLSAHLDAESVAKQQLCSEIARSGQALSEARAEIERVRGQVAQLNAQLAEVERARVLLVSEAASSATKLAAAETAAAEMRGEAQDLAGRLGIVENGYAQLRQEAKGLEQELEKVRAERQAVQERVVELEGMLAGSRAQAEELRAQLAESIARVEEERRKVAEVEAAAAAAAGQGGGGDGRGSGSGGGGQGALRASVDERGELPEPQPFHQPQQPQPSPDILMVHHLEAALLQQREAVEQLLSDCEALRRQRDTALGELEHAATALRVADSRSQELAAANDLLNSEVERLQRLSLAAVRMVEHLQQQNQQQQRQRQAGSGLPPKTPLGGTAPLTGAEMRAWLVSDAPRGLSPIAARSPLVAEAASEAVTELHEQHARRPSLVDHAVPQPTSHGTTHDYSGSTGGTHLPSASARSPGLGPCTVPLGQLYHHSDDEDRDDIAVLEGAPSRSAGQAVNTPGAGAATAPAGGQEVARGSEDLRDVQGDAAAYAVLLRVLAERAALERQADALQDQLQAAMLEKSEAERHAASLQSRLQQLEATAQRKHHKAEGSEPLSQTHTSSPSLPDALSPAPHTDTTTDMDAAHRHGPTATSAPSSDVAALLADGAQLRRQLEALTSGLQRAERDAAAAEARAERLQQEVETLAGSLAAAREAEAGVRQALAAAMDEQRVTAERLVAAQGELGGERQQRLELEMRNASLLERVASAEERVKEAEDAAAAVAAAADAREADRASGAGTGSGQSVDTIAANTSAPILHAAQASECTSSDLPKQPTMVHVSTSTDETLCTETLESIPTASTTPATDPPQPSEAGTVTATTTAAAVEELQRVLVQLQEEAELRGQLQVQLEALGSHHQTQLQVLCEQHESQLVRLSKEHEGQLQAARGEEMVRLQHVRDEYDRLEKHLQGELQRVQQDLTRTSSELTKCQEALAAAERQAQEAVREALRSAQQASNYQAQALALRQRLERQQELNAGLLTVSSSRRTSMDSLAGFQPPPTRTASMNGDVSLTTVPSWSHEDQRHADAGRRASSTSVASSGVAPTAAAAGTGLAAVGAVAAVPAGMRGATEGSAPASGAQQQPSRAPPAAGVEAVGEVRVRVLAEELQSLRRQVGVLERQRAAQHEELQRAGIKVAAAEARHATAVQQITILNAELRSRDALSEEQLQLRVAQQAAADARVLCEVRSQLQDCQHRLAAAEQGAEAARLELQSTRTELEALRQQHQQLQQQHLQLQQHFEARGQRRSQAEGRRGPFRKQKHGANRQQQQQPPHGMGATALSERCGTSGGGSGGGEEDDNQHPPLSLLLQGGGRRGPHGDVVQNAVRRVMAALAGSDREMVRTLLEAVASTESGIGGGASSDGEFSESGSGSEEGRQDREQQMGGGSRRLGSGLASGGGGGGGSRRWSSLRPADLRQQRGRQESGNGDSLFNMDDGNVSDSSIDIALLAEVGPLGRLLYSLDDEDDQDDEISLHENGSELDAGPQRRSGGGDSSAREPQRRGGGGGGVWQGSSRRRQPSGRQRQVRPGAPTATAATTAAPLSTANTAEDPYRPAKCSRVGCQTDLVVDYGSLMPMSRVSAANHHLGELQQQQLGLLAQVTGLKCQAAEVEALAAARTGRVAELQAREQQLGAACGVLQQQLQEGVWELETNLAQCQVAWDEMRGLQEADCSALQQLRAQLLSDVEAAKQLLRDCTRALRLGRASLQAHRAVDDALTHLTSVAAADPGGNGAQALHHVKVVFSCMAELCGRAEALATTLAPLVSKLCATDNVFLSPDAQTDPWEGELPWRDRHHHQNDLALSLAGPERPLGPIWRGGAGAGGAGAGAGAGGAGGVGGGPIDVAEVRRAMQRSYAQLHARARRFSRVLKAVAGGEQLPAEVLRDGFHRLWSRTEQQLDGLMRMASSGLDSPSPTLHPSPSLSPPPNTSSRLQQPPPPARHSTITHAARHTHPMDALHTLSGGMHTTVTVSACAAATAAAATAPPPGGAGPFGAPTTARAPLASVSNLQQLDESPSPAGSPVYGKRKQPSANGGGGASSAAAVGGAMAVMNRKALAMGPTRGSHDDGMTGTAAAGASGFARSGREDVASGVSAGLADTGRQELHQQQYQQRRAAAPVACPGLHASPPPPAKVATHQPPHAPLHVRFAASVAQEQGQAGQQAAAAAGGGGKELSGASTDASGGSGGAAVVQMEPQRRAADMRLRHVLNLAKGMQAKGFD